jgi:hypothetical protein
MGKQSKTKQNKKTQSFVIEGLRQIYRNIRHPEFEELYLKALIARRAYEDDPIYPYYEAGIISKAMYRYIWGRVNVDWHFWELVQVVEPVIKQKYRRDGNNYPFKNAADLYLTAVNELAFKVGRKRNQALDENGNYQSPSGRLMEKYIRELAAYLEESEKKSVSERRSFLKSLKKNYLNLTGENLEINLFKRDLPIYMLVLKTALKVKNNTVKKAHKAWLLSHEEALNAEATIYHSAPKLTIRKGEVQSGISLKSA